MTTIVRSRQDDIFRFLERSALFEGLGRADLEAIADEIETVRVEAGDAVMRQGEIGDCLYIVVRGRLRALYRQESGEEQVVGEICRGETIGEMALLDGERRSTSVIAVRDTQLLRLSKATFDDLVEKRPRATMHLARMIARRLRDTVRRRSKRSRKVTIAVVPAGAPQAGEFTRRLADCLTPFGRSFAASSNALGGSVSDIDAWMDDHEIESDFVLYLCDETSTPWSAECIRHADRILVVTGANSESGPVEVEALCPREVRLDLIVLHESRRDGQTHRLLNGRRASGHYHVDLESERDLQRVARALAGRTLGLVLSGGGARGFAQIGALRALEERGVPIDMIGGSSIGAMIAGLYASGRTPEEMTPLCRQALIATKVAPRHADAALPLISIVDGPKGVDAIRSLFGDTHIEDMWLRFFCVSSNLSSGKIAVHSEGPLAHWVHASSSAPGSASPVFENGDLLVDGGVLNSLPSDVMRTACDGTVIAVDVCDRLDPRGGAAYTATPNRWASFWSRITGPERHKASGLVGTLARTAMMSGAYEERAVKQSVELYLRPPVEHFSGLAWHEIERFVEIGYHYSALMIDKWLEQNGRVWEK